MGTARARCSYARTQEQLSRSDAALLPYGESASVAGFIPALCVGARLAALGVMAGALARAGHTVSRAELRA